MKLFFKLFFALTLTSNIALAERPYLALGKAQTKKTVVAFPKPVLLSGADPLNTATTVEKMLTKDLLFMDLFKFLPSVVYPSEIPSGISQNSFQMKSWQGVGADLLIKTGIRIEGTQATLEGHLYEVIGAKELLNKSYTGPSTEVDRLARRFGNDLIQTLTGRPGIFFTQIVMSCDGSGKKEITLMDFDGANPRQVTHHRSISMSPAWSPDLSHIAYSVFTRHSGNIKNIDLYEFDLVRNTSRMLSNRTGINSGAAYSPDGKEIALTMSFLGNPEIFSLNVEKKSVTRLTKSFGFDVDPEWSPDGKELAFVSSRTGKPMIHAMTVANQNVRRLTYAGRYNATPAWSDLNQKIVFAGWLDGGFDLFTMNPDGSRIDRLTKNQGSNEDPHFSPDGNFIVFSSNRAQNKNIYVMNLDGSFVRRLTYGLGNCVSPKWSGVPKQ